MTDRLAEARAEVARLEREIKAAPCIIVGHDWRFIGGRNCGCGRWDACSVPVHQCQRCNDCDYGQNDEARDIITRCEVSDD